MILLSNYSEFVERMWLGHNRPRDLDVAVATLGLAGESGEVVELVKKHLRGDGPMDIEKLTKELGDVAYYWTKIANHFGIDLDTVLSTNQSKLNSRKARGVMRGNGDER